MGRYRGILKHPFFTEYLEEVAQLEKDRIYCGHSLEHLLAVARIAYINVLEDKFPYEKDVVYAAALLHDIGRTVQYKSGIPHEVAAIEPSVQILKSCGYTEAEIADITEAISKHRDRHGDSLAAVLYKADKRSRNCYVCKAADTCNWPEEKRNNGII